MLARLGLWKDNESGCFSTAKRNEYTTHLSLLYRMLMAICNWGTPLEAMDVPQLIRSAIQGHYDVDSLRKTKMTGEVVEPT